MKYVYRHGKRIAVDTLDTGAPARRGQFKARFVKLPYHWAERLKRCNSPGTFKLAFQILLADFKRQNVGGEIILSAKTTGLSRTVRSKATKELVVLGLIEVGQEGNQAAKVSHIHYIKKGE